MHTPPRSGSHTLSLSSSPVKLILRLSIVLVLGLLIAAGLLFFFRNGMIETTVEQAGEFAFGVPTPLDGVTTEFGSGDFALNGFAVSNPEGFSTQPLFKLGSASMNLPLMKLFRGDKTEPIVIPEIVIAGLGVNIERTDKGFNFTPIMDRVQGLSKAAGGGGETAPTEPPPSGSARPIVIERIVFEDWTLDASFGSGLSLPTQRLSALVLTDVRAGPEGLPGIMGQITEKLLAYATDKIGIEGLSPELLAQLDALKARLGQDIPNLDELQAELEGRVNEQIDQLRDQGQEQLDQLQKQGQEQLDALKDQGQQQLDALKGDIFGQAEGVQGEAKEQLEELQGELAGALESIGGGAEQKLEDLIGSVTGEGAPIEGATEKLETLLEQVKDSAEITPETQAKVEEVLENLTKEGGAAGEVQKAADDLKKGLGGLLGGKKDEKKP